MTHFEHDNMFHPQILLYEVHAFCPLGVFERIFIVAIKSVHDVPFEMLQQVDLGLEIVWVLSDGVVLPYIDCALSSGRDVVEVTMKQIIIKSSNHVEI